jgi:hypothetical protein
MRDALYEFENHAVGVFDGLETCEKGCLELARLGLEQNDVGLVLSGAELSRLRNCVSRDPDGERRFGAGGRMHTRLAAAEVIAVAEDGRALYASSGYPADLIRRSRAGPVSLDRAFDGLLSEREGRTLAAAIIDSGVAIWVRTRALDLTEGVAELLLRISADRVRTFSGASRSDGSPTYEDRP